MYHYTYKRDGGLLRSAAASSRDAAERYLRTVFDAGETVWVFWPADWRGSAFTFQISWPKQDAARVPD